jgi:DNA-binding Lrp family transcriptional regulator
MSAERIDDIDRAILDVLQKDARISNVDLANAVGLSPAPCLRRVKALERDGVIEQYVALLNPLAVDCRVTVFVHISLDLHVGARLESFENALMARPEVLHCHLMTGDADYQLRVVVPDVTAYERFLKECLTQIPGVARIKSSFALRQIKYSTALPVAQPTKRAATKREATDARVVGSGRTTRTKSRRRPLT